MTIPTQLDQSEGRWYWEGVDLSRLAQEIGTPSLVYSANRFRSNLDCLRRGLDGTVVKYAIAYALKACSHIAIAETARQAGCWIEVMSLGEYRIARAAGFEPEQIIVNGLGWNDGLIDAIVRDEVALVNVDNLDDLERLVTSARQHRKEVSVGVRVIPHEGGLFAEYGGKLGAAVQSGEAARLLAECRNRPEVKLTGVSTHSCHRCSDPDLYARVVRATVDFAVAQQSQLGLELSFLDFGGGLDERMVLEGSGHQVAEFCSALITASRKLSHRTKILLEPGRFLIGDAGIALTTVRVAKESGGKLWLIADIGTNVLVPIPSAHFSIHVLNHQAKDSSLYSVGDGICSPSSVFQEDVRLPLGVRSGHLLCIEYVGSYTLSMGENWAYPLPQTVLLDEAVCRPLLTGQQAARLFDETHGIGRERRGP